MPRLKFPFLHASSASVWMRCLMRSGSCGGGVGAGSGLSGAGEGAVLFMSSHSPRMSPSRKRSKRVLTMLLHAVLFSISAALHPLW